VQTFTRMNPTIILKPLHHRGQESIALFYEKYSSLNNIVKQLPQAKWSQTHKCWYLPLNKDSYNQLLLALQGKAVIEQSALYEYLANKKKGVTLPGSHADMLPAAVVNKQLTHLPVKKGNGPTVYKGGKIYDVNAHVLPLMEQQLKLKAYSPSTIRTYLGEMSQLLQVLKNIPADNLQPEHLKRYLVYCYDRLRLRENTVHSRMNAMKFYYEQVLGREKFFWEIPRPKKQVILPKVLSDAEIGRMFRAISNLKHKAILFTAYSSGLRVSEVVNLKLKDIDSARMTIFIERAKGKKDRVVNLSPLLLDILRAYIKQSKPKPAVYLFESAVPGDPYSTRSAQIIFKDAKNKAGISKNVSFHSLRHSFATHLLEKGVDIRYIKDILGHFNIKTTERYTHVSRRMLVNIISPLDDLFSKGIL
jgi:integrase/recombinase XerD